MPPGTVLDWSRSADFCARWLNLRYRWRDQSGSVASHAARFPWKTKENDPSGSRGGAYVTLTVVAAAVVRILLTAGWHVRWLNLTSTEGIIPLDSKFPRDPTVEAPSNPTTSAARGQLVSAVQDTPQTQANASPVAQQVRLGETDGSTKPKYRIWTSERALAIWGAFSLPLTIAAIFAAVWAGVFAPRNAEEIINIVYGTALIYGLTALTIMLFLAYEAIDAERKLRDLAIIKLRLDGENAALKEQNANISAEKRASDRRFSDVATPLHEVSETITQFQTSVATFLRLVRGKKNDQILDIDTEWDELCRLWHAALLAICNAAAYMLPTKRGRSFTETAPICSANIKTVEPSNKEPCYRVVKRSHQKSRPDDAAPPRQVLKNMMYNDMICANNTVIIPNMDEYIHRINTSPALKSSFDEPNNSIFYKSCLIAPIFEDVKKDKRRLVAIFCIDSLEFNFFDNDYDKKIMTMLANQALTCLRLHWEAERAKEAMQEPASTRRST